MNLVDLGVLLILAVSALLGLSRGFVRELLGLGAWLLAGYLAVRFGPQMQPMARQAIGDPDIADPAAYLVVFVLMLIVLSLVANLIGRAVRVSALGGLDRTLGLVFGLLRGAVVLIAAYIPLSLALPPERWPDVAVRARSLPVIFQGAQWLAARLPEAYRPKIAPPPAAPAASEEDLLHATPEGRALGPRPTHT